jgi:hypothetical protein
MAGGEVHSPRRPQGEHGGQGIGIYFFLLLKFPQNHTIFEEKTNHEDVMI